MRTRAQPKGQRGMASVAVLLFAIVASMILIANFNLNFAVNESSDAFDAFNSQVVEKNGVAQIVKESILAVAETASTQSSNSLQTEITNRLSAMNLPSGASISLVGLTSAASVPANPSYPIGSPVSVSQPDYFSPSTYTRAVAGMGNLFTSLANQGPAGDLGRLSFVFRRSSGSGANDSVSYTVHADLFSVPLTNVDVVAYGLPASGSIPAAAPAMPAGFFGSNTSALVVTSNNPSNDSTAYPDLFNPTGSEQLPYQYRNAASFSWNAYEYLWSSVYQDALVTAAETPTSANQPLPAPQGSVYDFSASSEPAINGVSAAGNTVTIDCSAVTAPIIAIVDSEGIGTVNLLGSASTGIPFVLLIRNTAAGLGQTQVTFSGANNRPAVFYLENSAVSFSGDPSWDGGLFLDPTTAVTGAFTWYGHLSFYGPANPLAGVAATVNDSAAVKAAIDGLAPRVLLVSTTAPFVPSLAP